MSAISAFEAVSPLSCQPCQLCWPCACLLNMSQHTAAQHFGVLEYRGFSRTPGRAPRFAQASARRSSSSRRRCSSSPRNPDPSGNRSRASVEPQGQRPSKKRSKPSSEKRGPEKGRNGGHRTLAERDAPALARPGRLAHYRPRPQRRLVL